MTLTWYTFGYNWHNFTCSSFDFTYNTSMSQQYIAGMRSVETAEQCRSSWVHTPNLLACSDVS